MKALNSLGTPTPNFGKEGPPESVKVTSELVSGLGLTNNPPPSYSFAAFGKNCDGEDESATACGTIRWSEVGIIKLTAKVQDGNYLDTGDDIASSHPDNVGRFYPEKGFRPATDDRGRPTIGWVGYVQELSRF